MSTNEEKVITESNQQSDEVSSMILALPPKIQRFVHLFNTGQYTLTKLSQLLEVHPNTLGNWLKREDVKSVISDMQLTTHEMVNMQLHNLTTSATAKLGDLINSPIDGVALQAVKDVLDRTGHKARQEIKVDKTVTTVEQKLKEIIDTTIADVHYEVEDDE